MHQPNLDHPSHDLTLVAAHAAGDLPESDRTSVEALLASCTDCADLHRDLVAIAAATHTLPAPIARTRDFQLEPAQAERLRRGSWLRRLLQPFGAAGSPARPIAAAFTTLGVAGLLVATIVPSLAGGSATSAPSHDSAVGAAAATAAPAAAPGATTEAAPGVPAPQAGGATSNPADFGSYQQASGAPGDTSTPGKAGPTGSSIAAPVALAGGTGGPERAGASVGSIEAPTLTREGSPNLLFIGSLALLALGLALFGLRFAGRRVR
jgi:hypothetical protein